MCVTVMFVHKNKMGEIESLEADLKKITDVGSKTKDASSQLADYVKSHETGDALVQKDAANPYNAAPSSGKNKCVIS